MPFFIACLAPIKTHIMAAGQLKTAENILANNKPILTKDQAKRALGREISSSLDDAYLMDVVSNISSLVDAICETKIVPQIGKD